MKPRILVVDDDQVVLRCTTSALRHDFEIVSTLRPEEALELCQKQQFAAVVSDVSMPRMNGFELRDKICEKVPALVGKFVFVSGGGDGNPKIDALLDEIEYVRKPYRASDLVAAVVKLIPVNSLNT
jgi:two-component system response regulator AauR